MNKFRKLIIYNYSDYFITQRMIDHFEKRTRAHIDRVINNSRFIAEYVKSYDPESFNKELFLSRVEKHDKTKFYSYIYPGYVWINAFYNLKMEYPSKEIQELSEYACNKHYTLESHHPEYHTSPKNMNIYDLAEMVCDWHAMSQEYGTSTKEWFDNKASKKYSFTEEQKEFLNDIIYKITYFSKF